MLESTRVLRLTPLADETYSLLLLAPKIAAAARPGQIAHVQCGALPLRRPFGICDADREHGTIRLCFEVRGEGTRFLTTLREGDTLPVNGAVGHGFDGLSEKQILVVGGGIGVFPLLFAAKHAKSAVAALAFRTKSRAVLQTEFEDVCSRVAYATDDGSLGFSGYAADLTRELLSREHFDQVCVCGPFLMMKTVAAVAKESGVPCEVSLEERMGCGVGACLSCVCQTILPSGEAGQKRVCIDGPVFDAETVRWNA